MSEADAKASATRDKSRRGRAFVPTDEQRARVRKMAGLGVPQRQIAKALRMRAETMAKAFRDELDVGEVEANTTVLGALYESAVSGNVAAQIFWTKARLGWSEKSRIEHTGAEGGPIETQATVRIYLPDNGR